MLDDALAACDAYVARIKGPPGRAQVWEITARLRFVSAAYRSAMPIETVAAFVAPAAVGGWLAHG